MVPAHLNLCPDHGASVQRRLRLKVQLKLARTHRAPQFGEQLQPPQMTRRVCRVKKDGPGAADICLL